MKSRGGECQDGIQAERLTVKGHRCNIAILRLVFKWFFWVKQTPLCIEHTYVSTCRPIDRSRSKVYQSGDLLGVCNRMYVFVCVYRNLVDCGDECHGKETRRCFCAHMGLSWPITCMILWK